jgi:hypothetical protein
LAKSPAVLLLDDGELDDVQGVLEDLKVEFGRVRGGAIVPETPPPRRLLIATPRRMQAVRGYDEELDGPDRPVRIVVAEGDSNTLRARLREIGFDYIVRRPVHPEALRLLLLRSLYRGDERRREPRVPVGCEISFKAGLLQRKALLADLSSGGCRLLTSYAINPRKLVKIQIPETLGNGQALALTARVLRRQLQKADEEEAGVRYTAALAFEDLSDAERAELQRIIEARGKGPATLGQPGAGASDPRSELPDAGLLEKPSRPRADPRAEPEMAAAPAAPEPASEPPPDSAAEERIARAAAELDDLGDDLELDAEFDFDAEDLQQVDLEVEIRLEDEVGRIDPDAETLPELELDVDPSESLPPLEVDGEIVEPDSGERRHSRRGTFERKVPAFGNRALRVLVGRDLSMQGMRVERFTGLEVGDRLHVALYGDADETEPLLVWATVSRDDGEEGMALVFDEVGRGVARKLEALVCSLPAVESLHDDECGAMGTVVGEVLDA